MFLSVKKLRFLHSVHSKMILSLGIARYLVSGYGSRATGHETRDPPLATVRYLRILVTTPAPTVRPPSRIANRSPSSIAIGVISSIVMVTLSPGITISVL